MRGPGEWCARSTRWATSIPARSPFTTAFLAANLFEFCRGGCMAATSFTGLPMDGPDPEDLKEYGEAALARERTVPAPSRDHLRRPLIRNEPGLLQLGRREDATAPPVSPCAEIPLAGFRP